MTMFSRLFTPLDLGRVKLANRICLLAHRTNFADQGLINQRLVAYYRRRAAGGCGLIIVGELSIHPNDRPWGTMIQAHEPGVVESYRKLTRSVHQFETLIFAQLNHHGFQSSGAISRRPVWGPSPLNDIVFGETAKIMEQEDMEELVRAFSQAAVWAREGGFDGLEIDMGEQSILRQFLSPLSNHRQDHYGGGLENRMRLPLEVIQGVREAVGFDFTVGVRLCADEKFWGGISVEESRQFARRFEETGQVDFINVTVGTYYNLYLVLASMHTPPGFTVEVTGQIKEVVNLPVMASYQIHSPGLAEEVLAQGKADAIGFVRPLICDPDFPNKAREGRLEHIRYCVRDNKGCVGRINQAKPLGCIQNPSVGYEHKAVSGAPSHVSTAVKKKVMIIGAGPAGLEAARTAAQRGHQVVVYEKEEAPGGQVNLIVKRPGREGMAEVVNYLLRRLKELKVPLETGVEVTPEMVLAQAPQVVIVATGSQPHTRPVAGEYGPPLVLSVWDVLKEGYPLGEKILFVDEDGGHHATATVEFLAEQGKKVHMVTSNLFIGLELAPLGDLYLTRQRLLQKGVTFSADLVVDRVDGARVQARNLYTNQPVILEGYDNIILDMGNRACDRLYRQLKGQCKELYRIGDCVAPRGIDMAIFEGRRIGQKI